MANLKLWILIDQFREIEEDCQLGISCFHIGPISPGFPEIIENVYCLNSKFAKILKKNITTKNRGFSRKKNATIDIKSA